VESEHHTKRAEAPFLGILMLESQFPRILGDIGHSDSWPFPVRYAAVASATPEAAVKGDPAQLTELFIEAARGLIADGAVGITTSCGFLSLVQDELAAAIEIPVASSSLMQVPMVQATLPPGKCVGILTIDASSLSSSHLQAANVSIDTPVFGTDPNGAFAMSILQNQTTLDVEASRAENVAAARTLVEQSPNVAAIVLECTNMVPYAADIQRATGRPVYSIYTFVHWFYNGLNHRTFAAS